MSEVYDYWSKEDWIQHTKEIECELDQALAQVAVLRDALEMSKAVFSEGFDENKPAMFFIGGIKCLDDTIDQALSATHDKAEKMLEVVRAAEECVDKYNAGEDWNPQFHAVSDVLFENIRLAVKAYKGE